MTSDAIRRLRTFVFELGYAGSLVLGIIFVSFLLFQAFPGDPARLALGAGASETAVSQLREQWGLNQPVGVRFSNYLTRLAHLDLGVTYRDGQSVSRLVAEKFYLSASIGLRAAAAALLFSYLAHLMAFFWPAGHLVTRFGRWAGIVPSFLVAIFGGLLVSTLLPNITLSPVGNEFWSGHWLAVAVLMVYPAALMTRVLEGRFEELRRSPFFRAQMAVGYPRLHLFHRCLLRPAAVSWLAVMFNQLALLFLATMIVEIIFSIPGSGQLLAQAVQRSEFPLIQGILVVNGVFFIGLHFISEQLYAFLQPRSGLRP